MPARIISLTCLFVASLSASSLADGMFVWRTKDADIREPEQKALILFDNGLEDLVLEVRYEGAPSTFGWIVPLPSRPRLRADYPELFAELSQTSQDPRQPRSIRGHRMGRALGSNPEVRILDRARVGIYDAAVVQASDGKGLAHWLGRNGFRAPPDAEDILGDYARRGWVFAALRISPGLADTSVRNALASGTIQPVRFRFRTAEPVFPLRISALGRDTSQVLLYVIARTPLVHRTCNRATWSESAIGPTYRWEWDADSTFRGLANGAGFMTKLRSSVAPDDMEDVYFRPYDPVAGLSSTLERDQLEAIAHLGWLKPVDAAEHLVRLAEAKRTRGPHGTTLSWALGEVGGLEAETALLQIASEEPRGDPQFADEWWYRRIEAIESLARIKSREAFPLYVRGLAIDRVDQPYQRHFIDSYVEACFEHLVSQGDASCIPALRAIPRDPRARTRALELHRFDPGDRVLAALAACGDGEARDTIVARLVDGRGLTTHEALRRSIRSTGSINGFPSGLWPVVHLMRYGNPHGGWRELSTWHELLKAKPDVHDEVLRRAASDPVMTGFGKTILLGLLAKPSPGDADEIARFARRSRAADPLYVTLATGFMRNSTPLRYNVPFWTATYALGRHRAAGPLLDLWREAGTGPDSRVPLVFALALADTEAVVPALEEYVRSDWNAYAGSAAYRDAVIASSGSRPVSKHDMESIGGPYGTTFIVDVVRRRGGPKVTFPLMTDTTLSPWLRLYWVTSTHDFTSAERDHMPAVRQALAQIERTSTDAVLQQGVVSARRWLGIVVKVRAELDAKYRGPWSRQQP